MNGYTWVMILPKNRAWRIFQRWCRVLVTKVVHPNNSFLKMHLQHQDQRGSLVRQLGNYLEPRVRHPSEREQRHHCLPQDLGEFFHPKQLSPLPERLNFPFSSDEILSDCEDVVSSGTDEFSTWVKTDSDVTLVRHMVDVQKAVAEWHPQEDTIHLLRSVTSTTTCLIVRLCKNDSASTTGIQDLDVEQTMPSKNKLQEGGMSLPCRRHVSMSIMPFLLIGQAVRFSSSDTFYPKIEVKSLYLHDTSRDLPDKVMEGDQEWVLQGVQSRASFRRPPLNGQKTFTVLSLHISNINTRKNGVLRKS